MTAELLSHQHVSLLLSLGAANELRVLLLFPLKTLRDCVRIFRDELVAIDDEREPLGSGAQRVVGHFVVAIEGMP